MSVHLGVDKACSLCYVLWVALYVLLFLLSLSKYYYSALH